MQSVKCSYCGKKYKVKEDRDCCPYCGSFNEFRFNEDIFENFKKTKLGEFIKKYKVIFIVLCILIVVCFIFSFINYNPYKDFEYIYSEDFKNEKNNYLGRTNGVNFDVNYHYTIKVNGAFNELYKNIYKEIYTDQFCCMNYIISINKQIQFKNTLINLNEINITNLNSYGEINFSFNVSGNDKPNNLEINLCTNDGIKDKTYINDENKKEGINSLNDYIFSNTKNISNPFSLSSKGIIKYDYIEIILDEEIYTFDINYEDVDAQIIYWGIN